MLPIKIIQCPNHWKDKERILEEIKRTDGYVIDHEGDGAYGPHTDWDKNDEHDRSEYVNLYFRNAERAILDVVRYDFGFGDAELTNYWYQQYKRKSRHGWHFHGSCLYHAIYYLELPEGTPATMCRMPGGLEFTPNAKEGDILIMSSCVEHCSPPNKSKKRKSIIAVNIDFPD